MKIDVIFSTSHWIVPRIIIGVVIFLGLAVLLVEGTVRIKKGEPFFAKPGRLLTEHYDKLKFWGTLGLFALYIVVMDLIGFLPASIIFIFLFNLLFCGTFQKKSLLGSAVISVAGSVLIWYVFGIAFNITLPTASLF